MNIEHYKENLSINKDDLPIIKIAKCYIKHEDKEKALQEIHSLKQGIISIDENGRIKPLATEDIDRAISEILYTDSVDIYIQTTKVFEEQRKLKELREVLKAIISK